MSNEADNEGCLMNVKHPPEFGPMFKPPSAVAEDDATSKSIPVPAAKIISTPAVEVELKKHVSCLSPAAGSQVEAEEVAKNVSVFAAAAPVGVKRTVS